MNYLSWLIYASSALNGISFFLGIIIFCLAASIIVYAGLAGTECDNISMYQTGGAEQKKEIWKAFGKKARKAIYQILAVSLIMTLIPSEKTVLMIAASQFGQQVVTSQDGQDVIKALKAKIMDELKVTPKQ